MAKRKWTTAQNNAIVARDGTLLVSAAAGSGKTAVLVERVVERICDKKNPCPVDELLVVTFTQAAAAEMRERISDRLTELLKADPSNRFLLRQQMLLPSAEICTIDKFCNSLVKRNYSKLEISPDFRILDDNEKNILAKDAADAVIEELYAENSKAFHALTELFISGRTDAHLSEIIFKLYENARAYAFPQKWLHSVESMYDETALPQQTSWGIKILDDIASVLSYNVEVMDTCITALEGEEPLATKYLPALQSDKKYFEEGIVLAKTGQWDKLYQYLYNFKPEKMKPAPTAYSGTFVKDYVKGLRDKRKGSVYKLYEEMAVSEKEFQEDTKALIPIIRILFDAVRRFSDAFDAQKAERNAYDFSDVSHLALDLLVSGIDEDGQYIKTELAKELSLRYKEILIDEYQDTNRAQDMLFSALSNHEQNLFMVGDVKQSIYGFRLAMPDIFVERRNLLPDFESNNYPAKITLDKNFRSRKGVTDCINYVFQRVMSKIMGGVDYRGSEELVANDDYEKSEFPCAELHIIDHSKLSEDIEFPEGKYIANVITDLIKSKMPIKTKNGVRPITYRDIAILLRTNKKADLYQNALKEKNIPVFCQKKGGFFNNREVSTMISFLEILDNPLQDVPLIAVLMSPIYGFTPDELATLRISQRNGYLFHSLQNSENENCKRFIKEYREYRQLSTALPTSELLRVIYERTSYPSIMSSMENGDTRKLNLLLLLEYAEDYELNIQSGLSGFIRYLNKTRENKSDLNSAVGVSESADVVRIMTIHASKGLEFPVVILADCGKDFNVFSEREKLIIDPTTKLGIGLKRITEDGRIFETAQRTACRLSIRDSERAEELRILYVALTRAKERLVMVGSAKNAEKLVSNCALGLGRGDELSPVLIRKANSYLEILIMAFMRHPDAKDLRSLAKLYETETRPATFPLKVVCVNSLESGVVKKEITKIAEVDDLLLDEIEQKCNYRYPYEELSAYEAKVSASALHSKALFEQYFMSAKPPFLCKNEMTPAMRGTATHRFLEIVNLECTSNTLDSEIERQVNARALTNEQAEALDKASIKLFLDSNLFKRMQSAKKLYREQKFTIAVPLTTIDTDLSNEFDEESTVVQGVIDCAFEENGNIVLVDYKTDRIQDENILKERYAGQLYIYKLAAREIFNMPVAETLLYSLSLHKEIKLNI